MKMVGLSVILENYQPFSSNSNSKPLLCKRPPMNLNNVNMIMTITPPPPSPNRRRRRKSNPLPSFLDTCFLCNLKLLPGKDIYIYKGEQAFCSDECRCRQIFMEAEEEEEEEEEAEARGGSSSPPGAARKGNAFAY